MADRFYKVVCTRRLDETWKTQALLQHIILESYDFLHIQLKAPEFFKDCVEQNEHPFVFTSVHAVNALAEFERKFPRHLKTKSCFCVDGNTRATAEASGFQVLGCAKDAGSLASCIIDAGITRVLHCSSEKRRSELAAALSAAGIQYDYCEVYEKALAPQQLDAYDGVIFYSPSQVEAFLEENALEKSKPAFCIGATTAGHLQAKGHQNICIAPEARTESILQTVFQYFNHQ